MATQPVVLARFFGPEHRLRHPISIVRAQMTDIKPAAAPDEPNLMPGFDARNAFAGTASAVARDTNAVAIRAPETQVEAPKMRMPDMSRERS